MTRHRAPLAGLPAFDRECATVVVETPKGSPAPRGPDHGIAAVRLDAALPEGTASPFGSGFTPSRVGDDGDTLGALRSLDAPTVAGRAVAARPTGAMAARGEGRIGGDRLPAISGQPYTPSRVAGFDDLRPGPVDGVEAFPHPRPAPAGARDQGRGPARPRAGMGAAGGRDGAGRAARLTIDRV